MSTLLATTTQDHTDRLLRLEGRAFGDWYRAGQRRRSIRTKGLPVPFDATFPPVSREPGSYGWERLPAGFVGPPELIVLGLRLQWVQVPSVPRPVAPYSPPNPLYDGEYVARNAWGGDEMLVFVPGDESWDRFRTF